MIRELSLRISPQFNGAPAKKGIVEQSKLLRDQKKIIGELDKEQGLALKNTKRGMDDLRKETERTGVSLKGVFSGAKAEVAQFGEGLKSLKDKLLNLKTVVAGGLIGGTVIEGIKKTFEAGTALKAARGRIGREFGTEGGQVQAAALKFGRGSGIADEDALTGLINRRGFDNRPLGYTGTHLVHSPNLTDAAEAVCLDLRLPGGATNDSCATNGRSRAAAPGVPRTGASGWC